MVEEKILLYFRHCPTVLLKPERIEVNLEKEMLY